MLSTILSTNFKFSGLQVNSDKPATTTNVKKGGDTVQFSGDKLMAKKRRLKRFLKKHTKITKVKLTTENTQFMDEKPVFKVYLPRTSYEAAHTALKTKWLKDNQEHTYRHFRAQFEGVTVEFEIDA